MKRVFILDDEPDMVKIATDLLTMEGFTVASAMTPSEAFKALRANPPDLLILDIRLPEMNGFEVIKILKADPKTRGIPVIMISVKSEEVDVVVGLEVGAEDYIVKPLRRQELVARVKAVLRRFESEKENKRVECGPITVDYSSYIATAHSKPLPLTPKEFELLGFFLQRQGRVVTRAMISENVWGMEFVGSTRTIDVHVDQIRKKLGRLRVAIVGLKGVGYRFELV